METSLSMEAMFTLVIVSIPSSDLLILGSRITKSNLPELDSLMTPISEHHERTYKWVFGPQNVTGRNSFT